MPEYEVFAYSMTLEAENPQEAKENYLRLIDINSIDYVEVKEPNPGNMHIDSSMPD